MKSCNYKTRQAIFRSEPIKDIINLAARLRFWPTRTIQPLITTNLALSNDQSNHNVVRTTQLSMPHENAHSSCNLNAHFNEYVNEHVHA